MASGIELNMLVVREEGLISTEIDDARVFLHVESGKYYSIDGVGERIWRLAETPVVLGDICDQLASEYAVDPQECCEASVVFIEDMLEKGLLKRC